MAEPTSKARIADDVLFVMENLLPFNDVQAELRRRVVEVTWPAVELSFFRRSRRDRAIGKPRQEVDVFVGCLPCGVMLGCPASSDELAPTLMIPADPGTEWRRLHQPGKVSAEERTRWLSRITDALAERVNRTPCRCAGEHNARREMSPQLSARPVNGHRARDRAP